MNEPKIIVKDSYIIRSTYSDHMQVPVEFNGNIIYVDSDLKQTLLGMWNKRILTTWSCIGDSFNLRFGFYISFNRKIGNGNKFYEYLKKNELFKFDKDEKDYESTIRVKQDESFINDDIFNEKIIKYIDDFKV